MTRTYKPDDYFYLHVDGQLIYKPAMVVDWEGPYCYFVGPYVKRWWRIRNWPEDIDMPKEVRESLDANAKASPERQE